MGYQGADWLERTERDDEEAPDVALDVLKIPKGATVADIGAGSGYMTVRLAARVGPTGRVFANDIQPQMLADARAAAGGRARSPTSRSVQGTIDDPKLPPASVDLELMVDVYHEFSQPQAMLRQMREALKPGGRLVLLEYRKEDPTDPDQARAQDERRRSEDGGRSRRLHAVEGRRSAAAPAHSDLHGRSRTSALALAPAPAPVLFTEPTFLFLFLPVLLALYFITRLARARRVRATGCCSSPASSSTRRAAARSPG